MPLERTALQASVSDALEQYFQLLQHGDMHNLYQLVVDEVEQALLTTVMDKTNGNQTRAAAILGISRSTLTKKLKYHQQ